MQTDGRNSLISAARTHAFRELGIETEYLKFINAESDGEVLVEYYDSPSAFFAVVFRRVENRYVASIVKQPKLFRI